MKLEIDFTKLPKRLKVDVKKGVSGALIAELPQLDAFTEANDLNELFFLVNDLIYTYFDTPKKYHDKLYFIPNSSAREELINIANKKGTGKFSELKMDAYYTEDLCRSIIDA